MGYQFTTYTTSEGRGTVELEITIFGAPTGAPRPLTLSVSTEDGSAGMGSVLFSVQMHLN